MTRVTDPADVVTTPTADSVDAHDPRASAPVPVAEGTANGAVAPTAAPTDIAPRGVGTVDGTGDPSTAGEPIGVGTAGSPDTQLDLDAIRDRYERYVGLADQLDHRTGQIPGLTSSGTATAIGLAASFIAGDVGDLIAEVERLRAGIAEAIADIDEARAPGNGGGARLHLAAVGDRLVALVRQDGA